MSKRGYAVIGIDLSDSLLAKAKEKAEEQQLTVHFIKHDARQLPYEHEYDVIIMLCEGAFPLMETDEMNYEILQNATKSLKHHGKIIFTTLNGLFPLHHSIEDFLASSKEKGANICSSNSFDLMTLWSFTCI